MKPYHQTSTSWSSFSPHGVATARLWLQTMKNSPKWSRKMVSSSVKSMPQFKNKLHKLTKSKDTQPLNSSLMESALTTEAKELLTRCLLGLRKSHRPLFNKSLKRNSNNSREYSRLLCTSVRMLKDAKPSNCLISSITQSITTLLLLLTTNSFCTPLLENHSITHLRKLSPLMPSSNGL